MLLPGLLLASWRWLVMIDLPFGMAVLGAAGGVPFIPVRATVDPRTRMAHGSAA